MGNGLSSSDPAGAEYLLHSTAPPTSKATMAIPTMKATGSRLRSSVGIKSEVLLFRFCATVFSL
jgi:hypothetical protein